MTKGQKVFDSAKVATDWWINATFGFDSVIDTGAIEYGEQVSEALLKLLHQAEKDANMPKKDGFKKALFNIVNRGLNDNGIVILSVDYMPNDNLLEAAEIAGINCNDGTFPPKTYMEITPNSVKVKAGYSAKFETIYSGRKSNNEREM